MAGAAGALVKDIIRDNSLVMPHYQNGKIVLGFIGGLLIGGFAGYLVDNNPTTAFLGGFTGYQIIQSLALQSKNK